MIPDKLKEYIDNLINKELDEEITSITSGGEAYTGKKAFLEPQKTGQAAEYLVKTFGYTKAKKPKNIKTFDVVKFKESNELHKEAVNNTKPKGRRFIPSEFLFPSFLLEPINLGKEAKIYFKIATNNKGESILMIDPLVKTALDATQRGRTSFDSEMKLPLLTRYMNEKIPNSVRGLIKKASQGAKIVGNNFIPLNLILSKSSGTSSTTNSNIKITPEGIQFLKDVKADNSKGAGKENEISLLIWLYKNQNKDTTPKDFSTETGESAQLASRISNKLASEKLIDVDQNTNIETDKNWYVQNPYMSGEYEDINVSMYESLKKIIKQELLNEISYRRFNENVSKVTPERKITRALYEVAKRIKEIEQVIEYSNRLKTENTIKKESFWSNKTGQLVTLSERLNELSNKIKTLSK
jgi:hypothetical protein